MSDVKRSTYQKVVEDNKKLLVDIKVLVSEKTPVIKKIRLTKEWREKFNKEDEFNKMMKEIAVEYIKNNPEEFTFLKDI